MVLRVLAEAAGQSRDLSQMQLGILSPAQVFNAQEAVIDVNDAKPELPDAQRTLVICSVSSTCTWRASVIRRLIRRADAFNALPPSNQHHRMFARLNALRASLFALPFLRNQHANLSDLGISSAGMAAHSGPVETATFASGCFWGTEHVFLKKFPPKENKGILSTAVGYTGGKEQAADPSYQEVCSGATEHAEAVKIEFDPEVLKYEELVGVFPDIL